jgi:hypothetical protein
VSWWFNMNRKFSMIMSLHSSTRSTRKDWGFDDEYFLAHHMQLYFVTQFIVCRMIFESFIQVCSITEKLHKI